jgi:hypothetical protein
MPFDAELDYAVITMTGDWELERKKMFGGTGYMLKGNMLCGVWHDYLIVRLAHDTAEVELKRPEAKVFDITGKPMKGWIMIHKDDLPAPQLLDWLNKARDYVSTLPAK